MTDRDTYPRALIFLHWLIVALIVVQILSADWMEDFFRSAGETGQPPGLPDGPALIHAGFGAAILIAVVTRFILRLSTYVPPPPRDLPRPLQIASRLNHYAFYAALVLLPLSGVAALFITPEAGDVHEALVTILLVLIGAHILGVLTHVVILRDGVIGRMIPVLRRTENSVRR